MVVVAPGAESVERRHGVPDEIAVAEAAALLAVDRQAEFVGGLFPELVEPVGARIAGPGTALGEHFDLHLAGVAIRGTAHVAPPCQGEQAGFGVREGFARESAKLAFHHRLMRDAIQDGAPANSSDIDREAARIVRERRDALHCLAELNDGIGAVFVLPPPA